MDPVSNPYAPGAGTPPPELAGRDDLRELVRIAVERVRRGMPAKSVILVGLRGVGKTVLLDRMREDAESGGIQALHIEAPEGRSLPALIAPQFIRVWLVVLALSMLGFAVTFWINSACVDSSIQPKRGTRRDTCCPLKTKHQESSRLV